MESDNLFPPLWESFEAKCEDIFVMGYGLPYPLQVRAVDNLDQRLVKWKDDVLAYMENDKSHTAKNDVLESSQNINDSDGENESFALEFDQMPPDKSPVQSRPRRLSAKKKLPEGFVESPGRRTKKTPVKQEPCSQTEDQDENRVEKVDNIPENIDIKSTTKKTSKEGPEAKRRKKRKADDLPLMEDQAQQAKKGKTDSDEVEQAANEPVKEKSSKKGRKTRKKTENDPKDEVDANVEADEMTDKADKPKKKLRKPSVDRIHKCSHCPRKFTHDYLLLSHIHIHDKKPIVCPQCSKTFTSRGGFVAHYRLHTVDEVKKCPHCNYVSGSQAMVNAHIKQRHEKNLNHLCDVCGKGFVTADRVRRHKEGVHRTREAESQFPCTHCDFTTHSKTILNMHIRNMHTDRPGYQCTECGVILKYKSSLDDHHRRKHTPKVKVYQCEKCIVQADSWSVIQKHVQEKHPEMEWCNACEVFFRNHEQMDRHMLMHVIKKGTEEAQDLYRCTLCEFSTNKEKIYKKHCKVAHNNSKPSFVCNICGIEVQHKQSLMDHQKRHFTTKNYQCSQCAFTGVCEKDVRNHIKRMHMDISYPCPICHRSFNQKGHMRRHMVIHSGVKEHKCQYCSYRCNVKSNLDKHVHQVHRATGAKQSRKRAVVEKIDPNDYAISLKPRNEENEEEYDMSLQFPREVSVETVVAEDVMAATKKQKESDTNYELLREFEEETKEAVAKVERVETEPVHQEPLNLMYGAEEDVKSQVVETDVAYQQIVFLPADTDINQVGFVDEEGHQLYPYVM